MSDEEKNDKQGDFDTATDSRTETSQLVDPDAGLTPEERAKIVSLPSVSTFEMARARTAVCHLEANNSNHATFLRSANCYGS